MTKKKHFKGLNKVMHEWVKPALKASTHVLTVGGIAVIVSPAARGVAALAHGDLAGAKDHILYDTTGSGTATGDLLTLAKNAAAQVGIPAIVGLALIGVGAYARKRIGN